MKNTRPTVFHGDQPEGPETTPGMKRGGGDGPADAGHDCSANAGKLRAGNAQGGISRRVAPVPVYYNEFDPGAAQWLRNLMDAGLIPHGVIDTRSIAEVQPDDLQGFVQCHFFAGIGGWPHALRIAGWPDDKPVWTGSCPCQPFSNAGKGRGEDDERHLWPEFARLISECRPANVYGEQVASKAGRGWLAGIFADLEGMGYAVAGADLCAAGAGASHIRQRLFWVADAVRDGTQHPPGRGMGAETTVDGADGSVPGERLRTGVESTSGGMADTVCIGQSRPGQVARPGDTASGENREVHRTVNDGWGRSVPLTCADGKVRRIPESVFRGLADGLSAGVGGLSPREGYPLAQGVEGRVTALKGIGNAIDPRIASEFIAAYMEALV